MTSKTPKKFFKNPYQDRSPVMRYRAGQNVMITLLAFAFSVSATRLFLEITGYPQLGGGNLHIAHVLWGGLFLFAATLIPIIYVNEWAATLSALLSGLGVGLFIDEVGKFITSNNDYFFPSAAPIVYVFFLLTVLLVSQVRIIRKKTNRAQMYEILERFSEVLDRDLSDYEDKDITQSLLEVRNSQTDHDLIKLADALLDYLDSQKPVRESIRPNFLDRARIFFIKFEKRFLTRARLEKIIPFGLLACGIWSFISPTFFFSVSRDALRLQEFMDQLITQNLISNPASGFTWFETRVILEGGLGLILIIAAVLIFFKSKKTGTWIGLIALLVGLTLVNLLVFYFDQFSTIVFAAFQFLVLILLIRYRKRFLNTL